MKNHDFRNAVITVLACLTLSAASHANMVLVDVSGDINSNGANTAAQVGSTYWNTLDGPVFTDLVDTDNGNTLIDIQFTTGFSANGTTAFGGLASPSSSLLGDFAVETATLDYFFTTSTMSLELRDLDPTKTYTLSFFGTRETTGTRITTYGATGANGPFTVNLQTSGTGIGDGGYDGNNNTVVTITDMIPNGSNAIAIDVTVDSGGFAYLGVLGIEIVPEPASALLMLLGGAVICFARRRR